jgi:archaellum biogenesis ATPase FlaH
MRAVRNTVDTGRTVVCTIHQPALHVFDVSISMIMCCILWLRSVHIVC